MTITAPDTGTTDLLAALDEGVLTLTLNRPEARNAMSRAMWLELPDLCARIGDSSETLVVIVEGDAGHFCAIILLFPYKLLTRCPPSTASTDPVMKRDASDANNNKGPSRSVRWPRRRCGTRRINVCPASVCQKSRLRSVSK